MALKKCIASIPHLPNEKSKRVSTDSQSERLDIRDFFLLVAYAEIEKRLLVSSRLSVRQVAWNNSTPIGRLILVINQLDVQIIVL